MPFPWLFRVSYSVRKYHIPPTFTLVVKRITFPFRRTGPTFFSVRGFFLYPSARNLRYLGCSIGVKSNGISSRRTAFIPCDKLRVVSSLDLRYHVPPTITLLEK